MAYNYWVLMDAVDVAVRGVAERYEYTGYIVAHGDKSALDKAKAWARVRNYDRDKREYTDTVEPTVYTFDNKGFTATILDSAGGSSQGGRLSFWRCKIEKDGVEFTIGVNDAVLADLIKNSHIENGIVKEKVMFARKGGQPGLIHEGMQAYKDATADMQKKADMKKAEKTKNWEIGGVYSTLTKTDICLGEVWDTLELYTVEENYSGHRWSPHTVTKSHKLEKPVKMTAWVHFSTYYHKDGLPVDFETFLKEELQDRKYIYFSTGVPPARTKASQLEVKDSDMELLDKMLKLKAEYGHYSSEDAVKGRYIRELKK